MRTIGALSMITVLGLFATGIQAAGLTAGSKRGAGVSAALQC
jgi:hypothetical protein